MNVPAPARPSDAAAAARFVTELRARATLPAAADPLLAAIGGNSPYLSDLALREAEAAAAVLTRGPDAVCDAALLALSALPPSASRRDAASAMRQAKRHVALATAMADIGGAWTLEQVTGALSDLADTALRVATAHLLHHAHARGELPLPHPASPDRGCGFTVLAMGKLGAHALNYSSDVDLVLLYDPAAYPGHEDDGDRVSPGSIPLGHVFARMARDLSGLMEARDAGGYVFRVDLRLRPDPASTPPAIALPAALTYYESMGQTWERAALIKARPVAGDLALGRRFLDAVRPFIWRRHLDFAAIADITAMKRRIDEHKHTRLAAAGSEEARLLGHDLKLGEGGIREVEFCAQTLQLVWGGRMPSLRVPGTLAALQAEAAQHLLPDETVVVLEQAYRFLRRAEHRLQMVADRQTHSLPETQAGLENFSAFLGFGNAAAFAREALAHLTAVRSIFADLFAGGSSASGPASTRPACSGPSLSIQVLPQGAPASSSGGSSDRIGSVGAAAASPPRQTATGKPQASLPPIPRPEVVEAWLAGRPRALRTERSRALLRDMLPAINAAIARQPDPALAMTRLDELIHRLPAGVQILSLLHHNPALLERVADVLGAAPALADHLATFPSALEGLVSPLPLGEAPEAGLIARLRDADGLDDAVMIASRMVRAEEFAIAVAEFFGRIDVDEAAQYRSALADAAIRALLRYAMADHESRYGVIPGGGMAVVALGKAGSGEMMAGSDLDLMLIYDHPEDAAESDGARALAPSQYFARAAQAFVAALTVATRHGPLYAVDMRLRPSGRAGPVAVSLRGFQRYHAESAWTWERLALTRARVITATPALREAVQDAIWAVLHRHQAAGSPPAGALEAVQLARVLPDTAAMRARMLRDQPAKSEWDVKRRAGGLIEVEFIAQALFLLHGGGASASAARLATPRRTADLLAQLGALGVMPAPDVAMLIAADRAWRTVQSLLRIALGTAIPATPPVSVPVPAPGVELGSGTRPEMGAGPGQGPSPGTIPGPVVEKLLRATGFGPDEAGLRARLDSLAGHVRLAFVRHIGEIVDR